MLLQFLTVMSGMEDREMGDGGVEDCGVADHGVGMAAWTNGVRRLPL